MYTIYDSKQRASIDHRLGALRPEGSARWGIMTASQMVCHLNDSYALAMSEKTASEDITLLSRTLVRWVALRAPRSKR